MDVKKHNKNNRFKDLEIIQNEVKPAKVSISTHTKKFHPKHYECDYDGKFFETRSKIQKHMVHHQSKVKCELCQIKIQPKNMKKHFTSVHSTDRKFQCKLCHKSFKLIDTLKNHIQSHNKTIQCQICSKLFTFQKYLNEHMKLNHENPESFRCDVCNKNFKLLHRHKETHNKNRPKPYKCQQCNYATDAINSIKKHQKFHENQDKKFAEMKNSVKCQKCLKVYSNKYIYNLHMKTVHSEHPLQCDLCGKYFGTKIGLSKHIKNRICRKS
ncbi:hypothetical protein ACKWTF_016028 [Chironomus riparius]